MQSDLKKNLNYIRSESNDTDDKSKKEEEKFKTQKNYIRYTCNALKNKKVFD